MSDLIWQGLMISVMGMSLTFVTLGLLILTTVLLKHFTRNNVWPLCSDETLPDQKLDGKPSKDTDEEIAAAIAVALAYLRSADASYGDLGATLEAGHGPWWMAGRTQQRSVNVSRTTGWRN